MMPCGHWPVVGGLGEVCKLCKPMNKATGGLNKREHFAAMAMQGILSSAIVSDSVVKYQTSVVHSITQKAVPHVIAASAVEFADALIEELEK